MKKNIDSLDGLRAFACLLVFFGHLAKEEIIFDIKGSGQLGVMLFFVLSGFLMAHLYAVKAITGRGVVEYGFRRCFRVLPAYVAVLFAAYLLTPYWGNFPYPMDMINLVKHLKLQGDTSVFWTIPVEMKFYLFFLFLWAALSFLINEAYKSILVFVLFIISVNVFPLVNSDRLDLSRYVEFFIGGVSAGLIHRHIVVKAIWQKHMVNVLFVLSIFLILIFIPQNFLKLTGIIHPMWNLPQVLAPLFSLSVLLGANLTGVVNFLMSNQVARFLGNISFSLYLVHLPVIVLINQSTALPVLAKVVLAMGISIFLSYIVYLGIEKPFRRIGVKFNDAVQNKIA